MDILFNGRILTLDEKNTIADCILIDHGNIIFTGKIDEVGALPGITRKIDLSGATVVPGFTDSHLHLLHYAQSLALLDCDTSTRQECLSKVAAAAYTVKPETWIRGHGWNHHQWIEGEVSKEILDTVAPHLPVFLTNKSLHGAWVNSKALEICGITKNTQDPIGGRIGRDDYGEPNGLLYESAVSLVYEKLPDITIIEAYELINKSQNKLFQHGITTVHDFDRINAFRALQNLEHNGLLKLRVLKSLPIDSLDEIIEIGLQSGFGSPHLTFRGIKLFMDGALGTRTAAMIEPYEKTTETGMLLISQEELYSIAQKASVNQLQLAIHSIGDLANRIVINTFAKLRKWETEQNRTGLAHRIEHLQTCQLDDLQLLKGLDIVASVQPIHLASDVPAANHWLGNRCEGTYAFYSISKAGIPTVFGSDAPVEPPDCLLGIHTAVYRTQRDDTPTNGWQPQEKIPPLAALAGFTRNPHDHFPLTDTKLGIIKPGYNADLVVINGFPLTLENRSIKNLEIQKTMIDGEWVWEK